MYINNSPTKPKGETNTTANPSDEKKSGKKKILKKRLTPTKDSYDCIVFSGEVRLDHGPLSI